MYKSFNFGQYVMRLVLTAYALSFFTTTAMAKDWLAKSPTEFERAVKKLKPGDTLVMADGIWSDFKMVFEGKGLKDKPITLKAQNKGRVILSGSSNLRLAGDYLIVSGLVFKDGASPTGSVISFKKSTPKKGDIRNYVAFNSRVTEIVIDNYNKTDKSDTDYWIALYGKNNRVDHSFFRGKSNRGVLLAVRLDAEYNLENNHLIDHNYFGKREPLEQNGGEIIRIGTSKYSLLNSSTIVKNNYFEHCNGEAEIISVKSGFNLIKGNTIYESEGSLVLRHGNNNIVEENFIIGNDVPKSGGIRIINKNQIVRNNYIKSVAGKGLRSAISVMNGVPNSPLNRYHQVDGAIIQNNSIIDSARIEFGAGSDKEKTLTATNSVFKNNYIYNAKATKVVNIKDSVEGITFSKNYLVNAKLPKNTKGFIEAKAEINVQKTGDYYPADENLKDVGASRSLKPITKEQTGVTWYRPDA